MQFIGPGYFDCGFQIGLCARLPDGRRIAVRKELPAQAKHYKTYDPQLAESLAAEDVTDLKYRLLRMAEEMVI